MNVNSVFSFLGCDFAYGSKTAVQGLSLEMLPGDSLGLLGQNGAGKTTTLKGLLGLVKPSRGEVRFFGEKPGSVAGFKKVGFAPESGNPPPFMTSRKYLQFISSVRAPDRSATEHSSQVDRLIDCFEVPGNKRMSQFSKGMLRRVVLAQAFLGDADLLLLDEPLNGLDPMVIIKLRELLREHLGKGKSLLFSSHIISEIETLCDRVVILKEGLLVSDSKTSELVTSYGSVEKAFVALSTRGK